MGSSIEEVRKWGEGGVWLAYIAQGAIFNFGGLFHILEQEIYQAKLWFSPFFHGRPYFHQNAANAISFTMLSQQHSPHPLKLALNEGEGIYQKKLDIRTFTLSYNNRRHQSFNGRKSRLG